MNLSCKYLFTILLITLVQTVNAEQLNATVMAQDVVEKMSILPILAAIAAIIAIFLIIYSKR